MTDEELAVIEARAAVATPGPWWATESLDEHGDEDTAYGVAAGPETGYISMVVSTPGTQSYDVGEDTDRLSDTEFIAHARQDVPALVAEVRHLRDLVTRLMWWEPADHFPFIVPKSAITVGLGGTEPVLIIPEGHPLAELWRGP